MFKVLLAIALMTPIFVSENASAVVRRGCEECPFPMSVWTGTWWSEDTGLQLEIKKVPGTLRTVRVEIRDIDSNLVVAQGIGVVPVRGDKFNVALRRRDGVQFATKFVVEPDCHRMLAHVPSWIGSTLNGQDVPPNLYFFK